MFLQGLSSVDEMKYSHSSPISLSPLGPTRRFDTEEAFFLNSFCTWFNLC